MNMGDITPATVETLTDKQLISIVETPQAWDEAIVFIATKEVSNRGGVKALKEKIEDDDIIASENQGEPVQKNSIYLKAAFTIFLALGLTFPFHYVIIQGAFSAFPKENLSLSHTFIFADDLQSIIERYNRATSQEKLTIRQEPLFQELFDRGYFKDTKEDK